MKDSQNFNSFADLKDALAEVRKNNPPAETQYQKQAKHMGYTKDPKAVQDKIVSESKSKKKKLYGDPLKGFPGNEETEVQEDEMSRAKEVIALQKKHEREKETDKDKLEKEKETAKQAADRAKQSTESVLKEKNLIPDFQKIVNTKGAAKVGGVMIDMFTASVITQAYNQVNDNNKKKMETSNVRTLVALAQKVMGMTNKEMKEGFVSQTKFKLKSKQYPRALAVETKGYGKRHATEDDLVEACDSFGMITEQELQIQQIEKTLGKKGFITYNKDELADIFEDRETQRMILAIESVTDEVGETEYTRATITKALEEELNVEFVKPDGMKALGPVLKMSSSTYNLKDMHTGKSFTYKYIDEDNDMKTFGQVIKEARFPKKLVRMAAGIAFDKRYVGGNMTGAMKAIEKLKKGLSDDPDVRAMLRLANESFNNEFYNAMSEEEKTAYQKFFSSALKKFGVKSPAELEGDKKKEFFNYIDKNYKGKNEKKDIEVEEGKYSMYSDLLLQKQRFVAKGELKTPVLDKAIEKEKKKLGIKDSVKKVDGRIKPFKEKMAKLGYLKR